MNKTLLLIFALVLVFTFASCTEIPENPSADVSSNETTDSISSETGLFAGALYTEDTSLGEGEKTVYIDVVTPEKTVRLTVKTDDIILGDVLIDNGLAEGEEGPYGLYIKKVNGISAVYETDGAYWSLSINGEAATTGADGVEITDGGQYELTYTKA